MASSIIPASSYYVFDPESITRGVHISGKTVTFYTFDGNPISTVEHHFTFELDKQLDPDAKKPQPTTVKIRYWPAHYLGLGMYKGCPGWFIDFYDKHCNQVAYYRYDKEEHEIILFSGVPPPKIFTFDEAHPSSLDDIEFPMDLSKIEEVIVEDEPKRSGYCTIF